MPSPSPDQRKKAGSATGLLQVRSWRDLQNSHNLIDGLQQVNVIPRAQLFSAFLTRNELPGVGYLKLRTGTYLVIDDSLKVYKFCTRNVFIRACLGEKCHKQVVVTADDQVTRHRTIELDTMYETVEMPAGIVRLKYLPGQDGSMESRARVDLPYEIGGSRE